MDEAKTSLMKTDSKELQSDIEGLIGCIWYSRKDGNKSISQALEWFRRSSENSVACHYSSENRAKYLKILWDINTEESLLELIHASYEYSINEDDSEAMRYLGVMYRFGKGVHKNTKEAMTWMKKAADRGNRKAIWQYLDLLWQCNDTETDSIMINYALMHTDSAEVLARLGRMYHRARGTPRDDQKAIGYMREAISKGAHWINNELFDVLWSHNNKEDDYEAFQIIKKYVETKNAAAMYRLSLCYECGRGTNQNTAKASKWLKQSAVGHYEPAVRQLAKID